MNELYIKNLLDWLDAGAPHTSVEPVGFDMRHGNTSTKNFDWRDDPETARRPEAVPECGTLCCIGGALYLMTKAPEGRIFPRHPERWPDSWDTIERTAADILGLPYNDLGTPFQIELLDPGMAPVGCTPQQAAEAVRRVLDGKRAWPD